MKNIFILLAVILFLSVKPALANNEPETLIILLDISGSNPMNDPQAQARLIKTLHDAISPLPVKSKIEIRTVGDDADTVYSESLTVFNYKAQGGDSAENLAKSVPTKIIQFFNSGTRQGMSALTNALWDANNICGENCSVFFFTDGMQATPNGVKYPVDYKKPLEDLGADLSHMKVTMFGVGLGSNSDVRVQVEKHWMNWLKKAKAKEIHISRF